MELFSFNPVTLFIILVGLSLVLLQIIVDIKDVQNARTIHDQLLANAKENCRASFNILIELNLEANMTLPFLSDILESGYNKLEVIVAVKRAAARSSHRDLINYKRRHHYSHLHIVGYGRRPDSISTLRRYGNGSYSIILDGDEKLPSNFFSIASLELLRLHDEPNAAMAPRHLTNLGNTVKSALEVSSDLSRAQFSRLLNGSYHSNTIEKGVIYRTRSLTAGSAKRQIVQSGNSLYITHPSKFKTLRSFIFDYADKNTAFLRSWYGLLFCAVLTVGVYYLLKILSANQILVLLVFIFAADMIYGFVVQARARDYSIIDRVNLILISPFGLLLRLITYVISLIEVIVKFVPRKLSRLSYKRVNQDN